jgi:hypothetical protein
MREVLETLTWPITWILIGVVIYMIWGIWKLRQIHRIKPAHKHDEDKVHILDDIVVVDEALDDTHEL